MGHNPKALFLLWHQFGLRTIPIVRLRSPVRRNFHKTGKRIWVALPQSFMKTIMRFCDQMGLPHLISELGSDTSR